MNPYDNNPFETDAGRDARSEFTANLNLAREAARSKENISMRVASEYKDNQFKAELATRESFYQMGIRHGMTRARNMLFQSLRG